MKRFVLATAAVLLAVPALAQPAPPAPPPDAAAPPGPGGPPGNRPPPPPRGAMFKIERPDLELTVRCADGDSTRACGEIVTQMIDKLGALPSSNRPSERTEQRGRDDDRGGRWDDDRDRRDRRYRDF